MSSTILSRLRALPRVAAWVVAGYVMVVAAASAAPWAAPMPLYGALCGASGGVGEDPTDDAGLRCALCLPLQAGAAPEHAFVALAPAPDAAPAAHPDTFPATRRTALPPARGPPSV